MGVVRKSTNGDSVCIVDGVVVGRYYAASGTATGDRHLKVGTSTHGEDGFNAVCEALGGYTWKDTEESFKIVMDGLSSFTPEGDDGGVVSGEGLGSIQTETDNLNFNSLYVI